MSCDKATPYPTQDPRVPQKPPVDLPNDSSSSPGSSATPDGHIVHYRRRSIFNRCLRRVWQVLWDPRRITWGEVCWATFSGYASYQLLQTVCRIFITAMMLIFFDASPSSISPEDDGFAASCSGTVLMLAGWELVEWTRTVVPWALVCATVVFVGEEIWRRRTRWLRRV